MSSPPAAAVPTALAALPSPALAPFVSHYWLSARNLASAYAIVPDGSVDLVIEADRSHVAAQAFGTSTRLSYVNLQQASQYLGIRFKPGQSRHFVGIAASELTDTSEFVSGPLVRALVDALTTMDQEKSIFDAVDRVLLQQLHAQPPATTSLDDAIAWMARAHSQADIESAAAIVGKSRRQFERTFVHAVGVSPKQFVSIVRFQHALRLMRRPHTLADVACSAGYVDQSHMTHEFQRLAGAPPSRYRLHVAFLQDAEDPSGG